MTKNFIEDGDTISITNSGAESISSSTAVAIGNVIAVAVTDIQPGDIGAGLTTGVFQLPKLSADVLAQGAPVFVKDGVAQAAAAGGIYAGVAWEPAAAGTDVINVNINTGSAPVVAASGG